MAISPRIVYFSVNVTSYSYIFLKSFEIYHHRYHHNHISQLENRHTSNLIMQFSLLRAFFYVCLLFILLCGFQINNLYVVQAFALSPSQLHVVASIHFSFSSLRQICIDDHALLITTGTS